MLTTGSFKCLYCTNSFSSKKSLEKHWVSEHATSPQIRRNRELQEQIKKQKENEL